MAYPSLQPLRQGLRRLAKRRAAGFWLAMAVLAGASVWVLGALVPAADRLSRSIAPRLPLVRDNPTVFLRVHHLDPDKARVVAAALPGLPLYLMQPEYRLVGMAERPAERPAEPLDNDRQGTELAVGIFPHEAKALLFEDTRFDLRFEAPSLALLYQDLMARHGEQLRTDASLLLDETRGFAGRAYELLLPALEAELGEDLARRLWQDPMVRDTVQGLLLEELAQMDAEAILDAVAESPQMARMVGTAMGGIAPGRLIEEFFVSTTGNLLEHGRAHWAAQRALLGTEEGELRLAFRLIGQAGVCLVDQTRCLGRTLAPSVQQGFLAAGRLGIHQGLERLSDSKTAAQDALALGALAVETADPLAHLRDFGARLRAHPYLGRHLARYGEEAQEGLIRGVSQAWSDHPELRAGAARIQQQAARLASDGLRELLLDRSGTGPNPFLVSLLRERMKGDLPPQLYVFPGSGVRVGPGHRFEATVDGARMP